jgi:hypothetical protein
MFLTTRDFLPQHRRQRSDTARLIAVAEGNGQFVGFGVSEGRRARHLVTLGTAALTQPND